MNGEFVAAMKDLDLYAEPYDPSRPVVCFDETSTQLLADVREPLAQPGRPRRQDYEYRRGGTRNLFLFCEPLAGWRHVAITDRRTSALGRDRPHALTWTWSSTGFLVNRMASLTRPFPPPRQPWTPGVATLPNTPVGSTWRTSSAR